MPRFPRLLRSFQSRIVLYFAVLLAAVQLAGWMVIDAANHRSARALIADELEGGGRLLQALIERRTERYTEAGRLVSADFAFKTAFSSGDPGTILSTLDNHRRRIGADVMLLASLDGRLIGDTRHPGARGAAAPFPDLLEAAEDRGGAAAIVRLDGRPYQLVLTPLLAPVTAAWVGTGFLIDDRLAADLKRFTGLEVSFLGGAGPGTRSVAGSTLSPSLRTVVDAALPASAAGAKPFPAQLEGQEYLSLIVPLGGAGGSVVVAVLQRSVEDALEPFRRLRGELGVLAAVALALSVAAGVVIARMVSRPVQTLVAAVREIEGGNYAHRLTPMAPDELAELATAINLMTREIGYREERLRTAQAQLVKAERLAAAGEVTMAVAHGIRNPLANIRAVAQDALDEGPSPDTTRAFREITAEADRLEARLRSFLSSTRPFELELTRESLGEIAREAVGLVAKLVDETGTAVAVAPDLGDVALVCDRLKLQQAIQEVLANSAEAGAKTITVRCRRDDTGPRPTLVVSVEDDGPGLQARARDRAFEPFFTTKARGTGMGLVAVRRIVEAHGGEVAIEPRVEGGTVVSFRLPGPGA